MYKKFGLTKTFVQLTVLLSLIQCLSSVQVGVLLNSHIRDVSDNQLDSFSETISKNGQEMKIDIFVKKGSEGGSQKIKYVDALNFHIKNKLNVAVCSNTVDVTTLSKMEQLTSSNCTVDMNSSIYFNMEQNGFVQYQKGSDKQRYSFGGLKYTQSKLSTELAKNPNLKINSESRVKNAFIKFFNFVFQKMKNSEMMKQRALLMFEMKSLFDSTQNFQYMKQISENQRQNEFCKVDIACDSDDAITDVQFMSLGGDNVLVVMVDDSQCGNKQIKPLINNDQEPSLLKKIVESMGILVDDQVFNLQESSDKQNYQMQFHFQENQFAMFILDDKDNSLDASKSNEKKRNRIFSYIQSKANFSQTGFFKLSHLPKQDIQIQVMACSGLMFPNPQQNLLNQLNQLGCENILNIDGIFTNEGNSDPKKIMERIESKQSNDDLDVKNFSLQKLSYQGNGEKDSIQLKSFIEHCDTIYDTILSVYTFQGNFFGLDKVFESNEVGRKHTNEVLKIDKLEALKVSDFNFIERRILNGKRQLYQDDEICSEHKLKKCCGECCLQTLIIACVHACVGCCCFLIQFCLNKLTGSRLRSRILNNGEALSNIKIKLDNNFGEYIKVIDTIKQKQFMTMEEFNQVFNSNTYLNDMIKTMDSQVKDMFQKLPDEIPEKMEIDGEKIDLIEQSKDIMKTEQEQIKKFEEEAEDMLLII